MSPDAESASAERAAREIVRRDEELRRATHFSEQFEIGPRLGDYCAVNGPAVARAYLELLEENEKLRRFRDEADEISRRIGEKLQKVARNAEEMAGKIAWLEGENGRLRHLVGEMRESDRRVVEHNWRLEEGRFGAGEGE